MGSSVARLNVLVLVPVEDSCLEELVVGGALDSEAAAAARGMMPARHQPRHPLGR